MTDKQQAFINALRENIQAGEAQLDEATQLKTFTWDSFAWVSTMASIDDVYGKLVEARKLSECSTVGDVLKLIEATP